MWIYWVYDEDRNWSKIGITQDFGKRKNQIENASGSKTWTIFKGKSNDDEIQSLEKYIHSVLAENRKTGEWFDLSDGKNAIKAYRILLNHFNVDVWMKQPTERLIGNTYQVVQWNYIMMTEPELLNNLP